MANTVKALVVGGGGNSTSGNGAGGAGGYQYDATHSVTPQAYSIVVGGAESASSFDTITANGGGRGGAFNGVGGNGGSGGGGGGGGTFAGGTGSQGSNGGVGSGSFGGGGGGAGGVGAAGTSNAAGGVGIANSISGASVYYCGGGGGGNSGVGGLGGGGTAQGGSSGGNGIANTGGGGGTCNGGVGTGGSGIVIISYITGTLNATGGTITTVGSETIHTFTTNGTWTFVNAIYTIPATKQSYTFTGEPVTLKNNFVVSATKGIFTVTTFMQSIIRNIYWARATKNITTWINSTKN